MENNQISLAVTTHNRSKLVYEALRFIYEDPRISEIIVLDDCTEISKFRELEEEIRPLQLESNKINLLRNDHNYGMSLNKYKAIEACNNDYVLILDSDNIIYRNYLDAFYALEPWLDINIYAPELALPEFDYTEFSDKLINKRNVKEFLDKPFFNTFLNTGNYIVPRINYLNTYQINDAIKESDTIYFAYLWLNAGYNIKIVDNMCYFHRVHKEAGFLENLDYNLKKAQEYIDLMKKF